MLLVRVGLEAPVYHARFTADRPVPVTVTLLRDRLVAAEIRPDRFDRDLETSGASVSLRAGGADRKCAS